MRNNSHKLAFSLTIAIGSVACSGESPAPTEYAGDELQFVGKTRATHSLPKDFSSDSSGNEPVRPEVVDDEATVRTGGAYLDVDDHLEYYAPPDPVLAARKRAEYDARFPEATEKGTVETRRQAIVIGSDGRVARNENTDPYDMIVQYWIPLNNNQALTCTATMIGNRYASTAAHCVYDRGEDAWIYGNTSASTLAAAGLQADRGFVCSGSGASTTCIWVQARWRPSDFATTTFIQREHDYALLELNWDLGATTGTMALSSITSESSLKSLSHFNAGYPGEVDGNNVSGQWGMACDVKGTTSDGKLNHKCDTSDGHSGGPLYYWNSTYSRYYMTGIHSGNNGTSNTGPLVGEVRDWFTSKM